MPNNPSISFRLSGWSRKKAARKPSTLLSTRRFQRIQNGTPVASLRDATTGAMYQFDTEDEVDEKIKEILEMEANGSKTAANDPLPDFKTPLKSPR